MKHAIAVLIAILFIFSACSMDESGDSTSVCSLTVQDAQSPSAVAELEASAAEAGAEISYANDSSQEAPVLQIACGSIVNFPGAVVTLDAAVELIENGESKQVSLP